MTDATLVPEGTAVIWMRDDIPADGKARFRQVPGRLLMIDLDDDGRVMSRWPVSVMVSVSEHQVLS